MSKVSVVTPSYNQAEFIREALESVQRQSYGTVEHIVVDGASDDGTPSILQQYDVDWISESDDSQAEALNKAFDRVSGDIIGWLNADEVYFDVNVLARVVEYFESSSADVLYGDIGLLNPSSDVLKLWTVPDFDYGLLCRYCFIEQPAAFFRRQVIDTHRMDTTVNIAIDYDFWLRIGREYEFKHVRDVLAGDRNHIGRMSIELNDELRADSKRIRARHGCPRSYSSLERASDLLCSGIPRTLETLYRTVQIHRNPPQFAFDGELRPIPEMIANTPKKTYRLL